MGQNPHIKMEFYTSSLRSNLSPTTHKSHLNLQGRATMSYLRKEKLHFHLQEVLAVAQFIGATTALYFILVNRPPALQPQRFTMAAALALDEKTVVAAHAQAGAGGEALPPSASSPPAAAAPQLR